jgi:hypothetical protein
MTKWRYITVEKSDGMTYIVRGRRRKHAKRYPFSPTKYQLFWNDHWHKVPRNGGNPDFDAAFANAKKREMKKYYPNSGSGSSGVSDEGSSTL